MALTYARARLLTYAFPVVVGGASVKTGISMDDSYQWFSATAAYLCVEFDPAVHRTAANPVPGESVPGLAEQVLSPEHLNRELASPCGEDTSGARPVENQA